MRIHSVSCVEGTINHSSYNFSTGETMIEFCSENKSANVASATSSGPVVVSLPTVTTRKTRVASAGTEEAVTGRQEATVLSR